MVRLTHYCHSIGTQKTQTHALAKSLCLYAQARQPSDLSLDLKLTAP